MGIQLKTTIVYEPNKRAMDAARAMVDLGTGKTMAAALNTIWE